MASKFLPDLPNVIATSVSSFTYSYIVWRTGSNISAAFSYKWINIQDVIARWKKKVARIFSNKRLISAKMLLWEGGVAGLFWRWLLVSLFNESWLYFDLIFRLQKLYTRGHKNKGKYLIYSYLAYALYAREEDLRQKKNQAHSFARPFPWKRPSNEAMALSFILIDGSSHKIFLKSEFRYKADYHWNTVAFR